MDDNHISSSRYVYIHETGKWSSQVVDVHHVIVRERGVLKGVACFSALTLLLNVSYLLLVQDKSAFVLLLCSVMGVLFTKFVRQRRVERESIVVIPAFGVQLESHYRSGKAIRRFVPFDRILKPVLNECVTPVTCYWSLALILRDKDNLMLVFKEMGPPLKMLAPIWKALCVATDHETS